MNSRKLRLALFIAALLCWAELLVRLALTGEPSQWDVEVYYYSAKAFSLGLNPYDPSDVCAVAGRWEPDFLYLPYYPLSIFLLKPLVLLSFEQARLVLFLLKCAAFVYLLLLWQFKFMNEGLDPLFLIFCLFGFNAALYLDLRSGNISLLEQALIWTALLAFVRGKITLFCAFIGLASIFKLTPLLFGGLLLFHDRPIARRPILIMIAGFSVGSLILMLEHPDFFSGFLEHSLFQAKGRFLGILNPSALSLIRMLSQRVEAVTGASVPEPLQMGLYLVLVTSVLFASWTAFRKLNMESIDGRKTAVCLACLVYALVQPRFQDYQWVIVLLPTYFAMSRVECLRAFPMLFFICCLSGANQRLPASDFFFKAFWAHYPLVVVAIIWLLYLKHFGVIPKNSHQGDRIAQTT